MYIISDSAVLPIEPGSTEASIVRARASVLKIYKAILYLFAIAKVTVFVLLRCELCEYVSLLPQITLCMLSFDLSLRCRVKINKPIINLPCNRCLSRT